MTRAWRFFPAESFTVFASISEVRVKFVLVTNSSSILAPFSEINRFASFPDLANPALTKAWIIGRPSDISSCSKVKVG